MCVCVNVSSFVLFLIYSILLYLFAGTSGMTARRIRRRTGIETIEAIRVILLMPSVIMLIKDWNMGTTALSR